MLQATFCVIGIFNFGKFDISESCKIHNVQCIMNIEINEWMNLIEWLVDIYIFSLILVRSFYDPKLC